MKRKGIEMSLVAWLLVLSMATTAMAMDQPEETTGKQEGQYVRGMTTMRVQSLAGVALGLFSVLVAWRARVRAARGVGNNGRNGAIVAIVAGAFGVLLATIHLTITAGAVFGSGSGKAGAIAGLILSIAGVISAIVAFRKSKGRQTH